MIDKKITTKEVMKIFTVTDHTGATTKHLAINKISAIQAHLVHFGLSYLEKEPIVDNGITLSNIKYNRTEICWDKYCCLTGATLFKTNKNNNKQKKIKENNS